MLLEDKTVSMQIISCFPLVFICHTLETDSGPEQVCSREAAASGDMETLSGRNQQNSELIRPNLALKDGLSVIECKLSGGDLTAFILVLLCCWMNGEVHLDGFSPAKPGQ